MPKSIDTRIRERLVHILQCLVLVVLFFSCGKSKSPEKVLTETLKKMQDASLIGYNYRRELDNKFNDTYFTDSASIVYHKMEESLLGFGLYVLSDDGQYLFDGYDFEKIDHSKQLRVVYDSKEIAADSQYFESFTYFSTNPLTIEKQVSFTATIDTLIAGRAYYVFKAETQNASKVDRNVIVQHERFFYLEVASRQIVEIQEIIIRNGDTLQIGRHHFTNIRYDSPSEEIPTLAMMDELGYKKIREEDESLNYIPISEGAVLPKKEYLSIDQNMISLFGEGQDSTLLIFSFIGCSPCERALLDLQLLNYTFANNIALYYSSFQNASPVLGKYLKKKSFPFSAFGEESKMIEDFSLYHAPSFVLIDSQGEILEIIEGYDEQVRDTLYMWLGFPGISVDQG